MRSVAMAIVRHPLLRRTSGYSLLKIHHVKPVSLSEGEMKDISYSTNVRTERTSKTTAATIPFSTIKGHMIAMYDAKWSVATFRKYSVFEPDDLNIEPEIPEYDSLNIRMRGYDFVILESFAKYVHNTAKLLDMDAVTWAVPARTTDLKTFRPCSTLVQDTHQLIKYERTVQLNDVSTIKAPLFLEAMQHHLPEGVEMTAKEADDEEDEFRFVPDVMLEVMQGQIDDIDQAREDRKK